MAGRSGTEEKLERGVIMTEEELSIARKIGKMVALGEVKIVCPECDENDPIRKGQELSSIGDDEQTLFCPGCNLHILLRVAI